MPVGVVYNVNCQNVPINTLNTKIIICCTIYYVMSNLNGGFCLFLYTRISVIIIIIIK